MVHKQRTVWGGMDNGECGLKYISSIKLLLFRSILLIYINLSLIFLGPLLPECLDVRNIPTSQIRDLTIELSGECH